MAAYNYIPQIRNTISSLMLLVFVPMCLGKLQRAVTPRQVQAPAVADLFLYFWNNCINGKV